MKAENKIYARTIGLIPEKKEFKTLLSGSILNKYPANNINKADGKKMPMVATKAPKRPPALNPM